ncbi:hypothetical protein [Conexibacter sp. SYSU D00693]|uniref:hypothetical protein n=1 Tax=Conexibacter sp. SYSU D00693 TaxID=2812560 RepID=UPI00196B4DAA|nr:hypothetical protein [Conexibacter sp. SYSU D00693]
MKRLVLALALLGVLAAPHAANAGTVTNTLRYLTGTVGAVATPAVVEVQRVVCPEVFETRVCTVGGPGAQLTCYSPLDANYVTHRCSLRLGLEPAAAQLDCVDSYGGGRGGVGFDTYGCAGAIGSLPVSCADTTESFGTTYYRRTSTCGLGTSGLSCVATSPASGGECVIAAGPCKVTIIDAYTPERARVDTTRTGCS